jgi:hypothetical protein
VLILVFKDGTVMKSKKSKERREKESYTDKHTCMSSFWSAGLEIIATA